LHRIAQPCTPELRLGGRRAVSTPSNPP
jgi:hypothetical protein